MNEKAMNTYEVSTTIVNSPLIRKRWVETLDKKLMRAYRENDISDAPLHEVAEEMRKEYKVDANYFSIVEYLYERYWI